MRCRQEYQRWLYITSFLQCIVLLGECTWRRNKRRKKALFLTDDSTEQLLSSQGESQRYSAKLAASLAQELLQAHAAGRAAREPPSDRERWWYAVAKTLSLGSGWSLVPAHWSLPPNTCLCLCITISFRARLEVVGSLLRPSVVVEDAWHRDLVSSFSVNSAAGWMDTVTCSGCVPPAS